MRKESQALTAGTHDACRPFYFMFAGPRHQAMLVGVNRLHNLWVSLASSLWFVPSVAVFTAIVLAVVLPVIDIKIGHDWTNGYSMLFGVGADGARGMLSAIAGSMMTVASLTFSLTIVTLAAVSSQYTSRVIRNFMRDRSNQFVLGYFVGLFAYCLVVLRTIRGGDEGTFVPSLAVMAGLFFALISIGVLIFFIHHTASSIQASVILDRVTGETIAAVEELFPEEIGHAASAGAQMPDTIDNPGTAWQAVTAGRIGYVQSVDAQALLDLAAEHGTVVRMEADIGSFVTTHGVLCTIGLPHPPDESLMKRLCSAYQVGSMRTIEQDPAFGVRQIVDIALKALSPGVNDTTTGVMCVEHLGAVLEALGRRDIPSRLRARDGTIRVLAMGRSFEAIVALCFDQIRLCAGKNVAIIMAMLRAIENTARQTEDPKRRETLAAHAELIAALADSTLTYAHDRAQVRTSLQPALRELNVASSRPIFTLLPAEFAQEDHRIRRG